MMAFFRKYWFFLHIFTIFHLVCACARDCKLNIWLDFYQIGFRTSEYVLFYAEDVIKCMDFHEILSNMVEKIVHKNFWKGQDR